MSLNMVRSSRTIYNRAAKSAATQKIRRICNVTSKSTYPYYGITVTPSDEMATFIHACGRQLTDNLYDYVWAVSDYSCNTRDRDGNYLLNTSDLTILLDELLADALHMLEGERICSATVVGTLTRPGGPLVVTRTIASLATRRIYDRAAKSAAMDKIRKAVFSS